MKTLTAEQWRRLMSLGESPSQMDLVSALTSRDPKTMTIKAIKSLDFSDYEEVQQVIFPDLIFHKGRLYGKQNMSEMSFGLYIDLLEDAKDINANLIKIMTKIWREVTAISYPNRFKAFLAHKLLTSKSLKSRNWGLKLMSKIKFKIKDYETEAAAAAEEDFKELPADLALYTTTFFLTTSQVLLRDSLRSLKMDLESKTKAFRESLKKTLAAGDGSPTSGS